MSQSFIVHDGGANRAPAQLGSTPCTGATPPTSRTQESFAGIAAASPRGGARSVRGPMQAEGPQDVPPRGELNTELTPARQSVHAVHRPFGREVRVHAERGIAQPLDHDVPFGDR